MFQVHHSPSIQLKDQIRVLEYLNTGRVVLTGKLNSENTTIELDNLSGGIYLFSVGENMKQTFKVIKE